MSRRVTRASAARLNADPTAQPSPSTATEPPSPPTQRITRKRKADAAPPTQRESRRTKKVKGGEEEDSAAPQVTPEGGRRQSRRSLAAAMSSAGPSTGTSGETSPQQGPKDSSKRKSSSRRKSKEDPSASASGSASRKSKKGQKKDKEQDVQMREAGESAEQNEEHPPDPDEEAPPADTGGGADGSDDPMRRFTEEELDAMERSDDPFTTSYFSRFGGGAAGLSSSLRALSGIMSGTHGRLRTILEQLRTKEDPSVQLVALSELSELLLVSNEDNLAGHFAPDQFVKELVALMQPNEFTGEENPEMMLLACRCIANLMEALPSATASVVYGGAVPILCQKLLEIHFIDLAEQALSTLEKISVEFPSSIVREGGLTACLTYLDFFATSTQRTAVTTAANCCRNIPEDSFPTVRDVMPIILSTLSSNDQRVVEQASLCVSRIVDSFKHYDSKLEELVSPELLKAILRLLLPGSTNMIGQNIHTAFLRVLSTTARASPRLSAELMKMSVVDTLYQILTGVSTPSDTTDNAALQIDKNIIMQAIIRTPRDQIFETLNVICEILPHVSTDGLTFLDDLRDAGYVGGEQISMSTRSKKSPNDKRIELLKGCPAEVKRFTLILFPTLMHAYTSTVNLSVRQKVLTAQLKMLSNFDTAILEDSLRGVAYASHLASILTQQENSSLVTYALQAAELLLKRMESIYRPQFYREGVMAEVHKLAARPVTSDTQADEAPKLEETSPPADEVEVLEEREEDMDMDDEPETIEVDIQPNAEGSQAKPPPKALGEGEDEDDSDDPDDNPDPEPDMLERGIGDEDDEGSDDSDDMHPLQRPHVMSMQDIITLRAKRFVEAHGDVGTHAMQDKATNILNDLQQLATELRACYGGIKSQSGQDLFRRLAKYFDGDALESITSYELMSSGVVDVLLELFNEPDQQAATEARADFLEVFMATHNTSSLATGDAKSPSTAFSVLVHKLQDLLSRAEHFEVVTVHQNAFESNRSSATSMLAKTIRLKLVADEESGIPKTFRNIMVSIHAIATFAALDTYLRPRVNPDRPQRRDGVSSAMAAYAAAVSGRGDRPGGVPPLPGLAGAGGDAPTLPSLPTRSGSKKSSRSKSVKEEEEAVAQPETPKQEEQGGRLRRSSRKRSSQAAAADTPQPSEPVAAATSAAPQAAPESQEGIECADEEHLSDDEEDDDIEADIDAVADELEDEAEFGRAAPDPSAVNIETAGSGKVTARTEDGAKIGTPSGNTPVQTPTHRDRMSATARLLAAREMLSMPPGAGPSARPGMSYASALQQVPQDWHLEFSVNGQPIANDTTIYRACHFNTTQGDEFVGHSVWSKTHEISFKKVPGPPSTDRTSTSPAPEQLNENGLPASLDKHPVTSGILRLMSILHDLNNNLDDVLAEHKSSVKLNAEPLSQFVNTKLTAKLNRQLEEPLIVASQCLPSWAEDLARLYPFLFPFETRHLFLQSTSFGYSRSMARWQGSNNDSNSRRRRDEQPFLGRVQRQKVRISRNRILESAVKVMELYGQSSSILEVEYFEEVGTGLGPTLEFYSTVSKEFSRKKTKLWRENESSSGGDYAFGRRGLFPAPMSEEMAGDSNGQKVLHLFKMLGKFVARSMLDSRIIDVSFNPTFFRIGDGKSAVTPSLGAVGTVDQDLARSLKMLKKYVAAKQRIDEDGRLSPARKVAKINEIRINDARIDDLSLDFTLPGHPAIELVPNGSRTNVTIDNVGDYIKRVVDFTLGKGVQRQVDAFRAGFSQVFPYSSLRAFTPDELVMLFGRVEEDWSLETLMDSIKADHGYNLDSKSVRNLLQTMSELPAQGRRDFLQFITGSPKLPIGGFKSLTPMFTVVCKPSEPPFGPDDYLPSVMTCVNYLKMPDYSSLEVLKKKLGVAIKEGQGAFHLS